MPVKINELVIHGQTRAVAKARGPREVVDNAAIRIRFARHQGTGTARYGSQWISLVPHKMPELRALDSGEFRFLGSLCENAPEFREALYDSRAL